MEHIRPAAKADAERIAEMVVFSYRLNFYPIFRSDEFYFEELTVSNQAARYAGELDTIWVYDDGVVKGMVQVVDREVKKLFVEPVLRGQGIGGKLLRFAIRERGADHLWALEKNTNALAFYARHGFTPTCEKKYEEGTEEYLLYLKYRGSENETADFENTP